jgi:hypothetical protein
VSIGPTHDLWLEVDVRLADRRLLTDLDLAGGRDVVLGSVFHLHQHALLIRSDRRDLADLDTVHADAGTRHDEIGVVELHRHRRVLLARAHVVHGEHQVRDAQRDDDEEDHDIGDQLAGNGFPHWTSPIMRNVRTIKSACVAVGTLLSIAN